jgi:hypothetical protein
VPNALEGLAEGSYVRAVVLSVDTTQLQSGLPRIWLTLRPSQGGALAAGVLRMLCSRPAPSPGHANLSLLRRHRSSQQQHGSSCSA